MQTVDYTTDEGVVLSVTVRRATNRDALRRFVITQRLQSITQPEQMAMVRMFAELVACTKDARLPFDLPQMDVSIEQIQSAYDAFLDLDERFTDQWYSALDEANKPIAEPALADPNPARNVTTPSTRSERK